MLDVILRIRITNDEVGVVHVGVIDVLEDWDDVNVLEPDVHAQTRVPKPEEVRLLLGIGDVVRRLQLASRQQVLGEHVG